MGHERKGRKERKIKQENKVKSKINNSYGKGLKGFGARCKNVHPWLWSDKIPHALKLYLFYNINLAIIALPTSLIH